MKLTNPLYTIAFTAVLLTACSSDFLDRAPLDSPINTNFYQTNEQVFAATAPLYGYAWFDYNNSALMSLDNARAGLMNSSAVDRESIEFQTDGESGVNLTAWNSLYNVVGLSNRIIQDVSLHASSEVSASVKNQAIGEARFMRGLAYAYLVQHWGAVPIITDNESDLHDETITRHTVESVWEFIIRDFRYASKVLPVTAYQKGRLTKYGAQGMLAKMFLTRAGVSGERNQTDLDSAAYYAKQVIMKSGATLMTNYEDLFKTENNNNSESLFAWQWVYNGSWGTQNTLQSILAYGPEITGFSDGWGDDLGASYEVLRMYDERDHRRKGTFMYPADHYPYIHQQALSAAGTSVIQELRVPINNGTTGSRAWIKKYVVGRPEDNGGKVLMQRTEINTYILRLADVYLTYAEARLGKQASTTDAEALTYFNKVRVRAGLPTLSVLTADDLFRERMLEFAMEGQLWFDLARLHYYNPQKAYDIIAAQDRGGYQIKPVFQDNDPIAHPDPISWVVSPSYSLHVVVGDNNFMLPLPTAEVTIAPWLTKTPVPYTFN